MIDVERQRRLKYRISVLILEHVAALHGMTLSEYGGVYDSERHEELLNDLMKIVEGREG